jgi:hypothetical protein
MTSFQTVRLSRGRHRSPEEGTCVMELASMLAGEEFTDHPQSVCPVIGAFLRTYNDLVDEDARQELYCFASRAVGTRADRGTIRRRAKRCREVALAQNRSGFLKLRLRLPVAQPELTAACAAKALLGAADVGGRQRAIELLEDLLAIRRQEPVAMEALEREAAPNRTAREGEGQLRSRA